jgi:nitrate/TMAO reductase-like tetraheme cytochrome c subunit
MAYDNDDNSGWWGKLWRRKWLLGIPFGAFLMFVVGATFVIGSEVAIHMTGTDEFCGTACHSHTQFIDPEWKASVHYSNASGVHAGCADCHIPHEYPQKLIVKAEAGIVDGYNEFILGTISTREKFEKYRAEAAPKIWEQFKANDSKACRTCHSPERFNLAEQGPQAKQAHEFGLGQGLTCIDCHKGVAHLTPDQAARKYQSALAQ